MHNFIYWQKRSIKDRGRLTGKTGNIRLTYVTLKTFEMGGDKFSISLSDSALSVKVIEKHFIKYQQSDFKNIFISSIILNYILYYQQIWEDPNSREIIIIRWAKHCSMTRHKCEMKCGHCWNGVFPMRE